jgi:Icc-related predicted phosphoesterase
MQHDNIVLPAGDVLVHAGDFTLTGYYTTDTTAFAEWFEAQPHKYKILIPGNHDWLFEEREEYARSLFKDTHILINEGVEIEGLKFWGSPVQPIFYDWAFNKLPKELEATFSMIPEGTDVVITHTPPKNQLDLVDRRGGGHVGCPILAKHIRRVKPQVHIFGHIHEGYGIHVSNRSTTYINASIVNIRYKATNQPITIDVKLKKKRKKNEA